MFKKIIFSCILLLLGVWLFVPKYTESIPFGFKVPFIDRLLSTTTASVTSTATTSLNFEKTKIRFVGDIMFARNVERIMDTQGNEYPLSKLLQHPEDSYLVGNFESAISKVHIPTPMAGFSFSTKPEYVESLQMYGFTHLGIANNHTYDFGKTNFENTKTVLTEAKLSPFGDQLNQASSTVAYLPLAHGTVALLGIYAVDVPPSDAVIKKLVDRASAKSDTQIAFVHAGTEYKLTHSVYQEKLMHALIDAGVDVVIGHHPHVVEDIELYNNKLIFYSLGNFIFDQYFSEDVQKGLMLEMEQTQTEQIFTLLPVTSIGSKSAPRLMNEAEKFAFLNTLSLKSDAALTTMIQDGSIRVAK